MVYLNPDHADKDCLLLLLSVESSVTCLCVGGISLLIKIEGFEPYCSVPFLQDLAKRLTYKQSRKATGVVICSSCDRSCVRVFVSAFKVMASLFKNFRYLVYIKKIELTVRFISLYHNELLIGSYPSRCFISINCNTLCDT